MPDSDQFADEIILSLDWDSIPALVRPELEEAVRAGVATAVTTGTQITTNLIQEINQQAQEWASTQAAELVGMKYDVDGNLVPNPDATFNITETTRDQLREIVTNAMAQETDISDIMADIDAAGIFSEDRALMIARTEVNRAEVGGNLEAYRQMGTESLDWDPAPDACPECLDRADNGPYTVEEFYDLLDETHPNCRCGPRPHIEEEDEGDDE